MLRHRATTANSILVLGVASKSKETETEQAFLDPRFVGSRCAFDIDDTSAQVCIPLWNFLLTRNGSEGFALRAWLAETRIGFAVGQFADCSFLIKERLKKLSELEPSSGGERLICGPTTETQMRALSYVIALVLLLTGPSLAGTADSDLPGIGTFSYNGSPISGANVAVMAALGH